MTRGRPPTGSKLGMGGIIQPTIQERPMTQHGLGGMKTPGKLLWFSMEVTIWRDKNDLNMIK